MQESNQCERDLCQQEIDLLVRQENRKVDEFRANKFQKESNKHWDLFYKRNGDKFFKDRHWTTREFQDLADCSDNKTVLLEVGCGVGNFAFPLLEEMQNLFIYACDFSPRAVQIVKDNPNYHPDKISSFQCDLTKDSLTEKISEKVDLVSMVFVLSAISPTKFADALKNIHSILKTDGRLLFRDYAVNDMTMIRFGPGTKIADKHYLRQDGTTSYFFNLNELEDLAKMVGFKVVKLEYVHRKTINKKEDINADRTFVQAVFQK